MVPQYHADNRCAHERRGASCNCGDPNPTADTPNDAVRGAFADPTRAALERAVVEAAVAWERHERNCNEGVMPDTFGAWYNACDALAAAVRALRAHREGRTNG